VRIRIRRNMAGIVDGISLSHFVPGLSYQVSASLGGYLVSSGDADELPASAPNIEPADDPPDSAIYGGISVANQFERAADSPRARRRRKQRS
jgi:hypothetical protein